MSLVEIKDITFSEAETETFRGTSEQLRDKLNQGYYVLRGGNGLYIISKPSEANVSLKIDGKIRIFDVQPYIRKAYGVEKITISIFEKFVKDVDSGEKVISYTKEHGLSIK